MDGAAGLMLEVGITSAHRFAQLQLICVILWPLLLDVLVHPLWTLLL